MDFKNKKSCVKVSERLQQGLWALVVVLSLLVTQSQLAIGQIEFSVGDVGSQSVPAGEQPGFSSAPQQPTGSLIEAQRSLLKARQALAHSDVQTAQSMLDAAKRQNVDFSQIGDSPSTVQSMIDRQSHLAELANQKDRSYNSGAASFLLTQAEALVYYQDFETAEMLISQARKFPVQFNPAIGNPDQLTEMIKVARNNAALAQQAAQSATTETQPEVAPVTQVVQSSKKPEAMKLLSQAQLAMDQGNWHQAKLFVDQAISLDIPDNQFNEDEARPWQYELKIQNALNRRSAPAVVPAAFEQPEVDRSVKPTKNNRVVQADYNPSNDNTYNTTVSGMSEGSASSQYSPVAVDARESYQLGLKAIQAKDSQAARMYMERAWNHRDQLDGVAQQSIQDQLTRLTISQPASPTFSAQPTVKPAPTPPVRFNLNDRGQEARLVSATDEADTEDSLYLEQSAYRELQSEVFRERREIELLLETSPREALEKMTMIRSRVAQSELDPSSQRPLLRIIDADLDKMQEYIDDNLAEIQNDQSNAEARATVEHRRQRRYDIENQIQKLVEEFNVLIDQQRYAEAQVVARQAADLDPDNVAVTLLQERSRFGNRLAIMEGIRDRKEEGVWGGLASAEEAAIFTNWDRPVTIDNPDEFRENGLLRRTRQEQLRGGSEADRRIWNILRNERVQGEYSGTLAEAIDQLSRQSGVNIVFDDLALASENVRKDQLVDMPIRNPISLRSALQLIIQSAGLEFVVENESIKITTADSRQTKLKTETYYIGDLVMPIVAPQHPMHMTFMQPNTNAGFGGGVMNVANNSGPSSQLAMAQQLGGLPGNPFGAGPGYNNGPSVGQPSFGTVGGQSFGGITLQDFQPLVELIQSTISPDSWQDTGQGLGTVEPFVPNLSLIVSQTQEIQDQIQDLLGKLRELNDVQIVVEVRFITLADNYFERIGIDFDFSINDNTNFVANADTQPGGSQVVGFNPLDLPNPVTQGFTPDLDIRFLQDSFTAAQPIFGGFEATTAANFGFAILSDIEVFFLIQAGKGDERTSITQAPTVTMFNGQSASVNDGAQTPFVTSVIPVVGDFAVSHQPIITILPEGTNLNVTAVVSDDRQFVRLQLVPFFSQVTDVNTFTFDGSVTTERTTGSVLDDLLDIVDGGANADLDDEELTTTTQGITIQLPVLSFTTISTVVSVPDGGTVLLGGVKRMNESRNEQGVPFLSNIPYVNRLFKNVGIGHETSNLMMMVTPRIIIQSEIEEDQVGGASLN